MQFNYYRRGQGKPLLLLHGLGSSWRSWTPLLPDLTAQRDVIALDLPGFGHTAPLTGKLSVAALADAITEFLTTHGLLGIDAVGSSMGGRLVLELARRGVVGAVVSLDPGGFQRGWEKPFFYRTGQISLALIRLFQPIMPALTANPIGRSFVYAQYSTRPWALDARLSLIEMQTYAAAPSVHKMMHDLIVFEGEMREGAPKGSLAKPVVIGWGRHDRVCLPRQAHRALALFPDAALHWFEHSGHYPQWDMPSETAKLILDVTR